MSSNLIALQNRFLGRGETIYDRLAQVKEQKGVISDDDIDELARAHNLPPAHVRTVAKFYDELKLETPSGTVLKVCNGEACVVAGYGACKRLLKNSLGGQKLHLVDVTCLGYCSTGPSAMLERDGRTTVFSLSDLAQVERLIEALRAATTMELPEPKNAFYRSKRPEADILLRRFGNGADKITVAREAGVYRALERALAADSAAVVEQIKRSQIRGRGGAGFPAGLKLETVRGAAEKLAARSGPRAYVVLNADEGDAGAYIDKELMEHDPHTIIEGMALSAYAVGANEGYIYLRAEYPTAHRVMERALAEARAAGVLGDRVLDHDFRFDIRLVRGHGAYICGEETSLLRSLEGVPAQVTPKPPFPAVKGLRGLPTAVHNVETVAAFPWIVEHGGEAYAALGYGKSRGTKLVSLNTAVERPGLYEVELGVTLREIIFELAGGMADGKRFKAVQVGGPLGGIFGEQHLDLPLDFEALSAAGGMLGHAGMVVFPHDVDLVQIGRGLMRFCAIESCGKCFPCRIGSVRGTEIFDRILERKASQADLDLLAELNETMLYGSLCALGGAIPVPISNLLTWFIDEFRKYIPDAEVPSP